LATRATSFSRYLFENGDEPFFLLLGLFKMKRGV